MKREVSQSKEIFAHIGSWQSSGLSQRVFLEQHKIVPHIFYYWLKRYRQKEATAEKQGFIPVKVTQVKQQEIPRVEVLGINSNRIVFYDRFNADYLKSLLRQCFPFLQAAVIIFIGALLIFAVALKP